MRWVPRAQGDQGTPARHWHVGVADPRHRLLPALCWWPGTPSLTRGAHPKGQSGFPPARSSLLQLPLLPR